MAKEEEKKTTFLNKLINVSGAIASITIITSILYFIKLIPLNVTIVMGLFISLPIVFTFIFGIAINKPVSVWRHYGFIVYLIAAFIIYLFFTKPQSILEGVTHSWLFLLGLIISVVAFFTYSMSYKILNKYSYRVKASTSLGVSLIITFLVTFILKHYKIFELI